MRAWVSLLVGLMAALVVPVAGSQGTGPVPATRRVTIDVRVADPLGRSVTTLGASDFAVEIDARVQPVVSASYVNLSATDPPADAASVGRAVLVVVDDLSFDEAPAQAWREGLAAWLRALPARDRVGVRTASGRSASVDIGADRAAAVAALELAFAARGPTRTTPVVSFREALAARLGPAPSDLEAAKDRLERTVMNQVNGLHDAVTDLHGTEGTRVLLVVSRGLAPVGVTDHATSLRRAVDHAGVLLFAVVPDGAAPSPAPVAADNARLIQEGLEQVIAGAGGRVLRAGSNPAEAWSVVTTAVAGAYRLVVDVPTLTTTKPNLSVRVTSANATLVPSAASRMVFAELAADPQTVAVQVLAALRDGEPAAGLAVDSANAVSRDEAGRVQLLTSVTVAEGAAAPLTLTFVVLDELGAEVRGGTTRLAEPVAGAFRATFPISLPDGRYRLRVAVADAGGRVGTAERKVLARPSRVENYLADEPLVMWRGESPTWFLVGGKGIPASARTLAVTWELSAATRDTPVPVVSMSLTEPDGRVAQTVSLTPSKTAIGWRVQGELNAESLRGGPYTVTLSAGQGRESAHSLVARAVKMAGAAAARAPAVVRPTREAFLAALQSDVRAAWPRFDAKAIMSTALMRQLMEDLAGDVRRPLPATLSASLPDQTWRTNLTPAAAGRDVFAAMARAFVALDKGDANAALASLAEVSKTHPGSAALALLRGAAHAAAGRDAEAVAAWQSVLGSASGDPFWGLLLVDALGRVGNFAAASEALSLLSTAPSSGVVSRVIDVSVVLGEFDRARAAADRAASTGGGLGARASLYAVAFAYADALAGTPAARDRFVSLATTYVDSAGEQAAMIRSWIASVQP